MKIAHEVKSKLLEVCKLIEQARHEGYIINFSIETDNTTGVSKLARFQVLQEVKIEN